MNPATSLWRARTSAPTMRRTSSAPAMATPGNTTTRIRVQNHVDMKGLRGRGEAWITCRLDQPPTPYSDAREPDKQNRDQDDHRGCHIERRADRLGSAAHETPPGELDDRRDERQHQQG